MEMFLIVKLSCNSDKDLYNDVLIRQYPVSRKSKAADNPGARIWKNADGISQYVMQQSFMTALSGKEEKESMTTFCGACTI